MPMQQAREEGRHAEEDDVHDSEGERRFEHIAGFIARNWMSRVSRGGGF